MDLKTVFQIPDDDVFHIQNFNVTFMPNGTEVNATRYNDIIYDVLKEISIEEDDRKF